MRRVKPAHLRKPFLPRTAVRRLAWVVVCAGLAAAAGPRQTRAADLLQGIRNLFGVPPPAVPARPPAPPTIDKVVAEPGFTNEFTPHLTNMLGSELHFVRKVCRPTASEFEPLRAAGRGRIAEIAKFYGELQQFGRQPTEWPDPRRLLTETLQAAADKCLPSDATARYREEVAARELARKQAAEGMMLRIVDRKLALTSGQYEQAAAAIDRAWQDRWGRNFQVYLYDDYAPVPDARTLGPILKPEQKTLWGARPNHGQIHFGMESELGFSMPWGNAGPELPEAEELEAAPAGEAAEAGDRL